MYVFIEDKRAHMYEDNPQHADQFLLLERFRLLVKNLPKLYMTIIVIVFFLVMLLSDAVSSQVLTVWATVLVGTSLVRGYHWWRLEKYGYDFGIDEIRRRLAQTDQIGLFLIGFFASIGYLVVQSPNTLLRATTMLALWAAAIGTAFYLFVLPSTARSIVIGVTVAMSAVFLASGDRALLMATPMFVAVSFSLLHFLRHNFENFKAAVEAHAAVNIMRKEAMRLAMTDALTALPNRRAFENRLAVLATNGKPFALAILDLDGFKPVNDTYGHGVGDKALVCVAQRLRGRNDKMFTARLGGDEFALLIEDAQNAETVLGEALSSLSEVYLIDAHRIFMGVSCGLAWWRHAGDETHLVERADNALYQAKQGLNRLGDVRDCRGAITISKAAA